MPLEAKAQMDCLTLCAETTGSARIRAEERLDSKKRQVQR